MDEVKGILETNFIFKERYRIIKILGSGGMGTVYLASDLHLKDKKWAIKEIKLHQNNHLQFINEAKLLLSLNHPYLPNIIDYYPPNENNLSYLVMDYIEGKTLMDVFEEQNRNLPLQKVLKYGAQICDILDYLHNKQQVPIIYRDLKPANIMIDQQDNVRLIDFGIARNYKKGQENDTNQLGTLGFAAPEQFENKQTDHRSDIYSLGALIYYLLSQGNFYQSSQKPLSYFRKDIPHDLVWTIKQMIMPNPNERYQNILEVKNELEKILNYFSFAVTEELAISKKERKTNPYNQEFYNSLPKKLIIVANLSKRAGSTFLTLNLAKYLSDLNILTSILEMPFEPYIFDYFGLEQRLNKSVTEDYSYFYSYPHEIIQGNRIERENETMEDGILWMVSDPRRPLISEQEWNSQNMTKYLYSSRKADITLIDVGDYIEHPSIEPIIDEADLILVVVDPMPSEIILNIKRLEKIIEDRKNDLPYELVVNKFTSGINKRELLKALKVNPLAIIPAVNLSSIHLAVYEGNIPYSNQDIKAAIENPLFNIASKIIPEQILFQEKGHYKKSKLSKILFKG